MTDLAYADRDCVLCGQRHAPCVFTAGSLRCIREPCPNPHHRRPADHMTARRPAGEHK